MRTADFLNALTPSELNRRIALAEIDAIGEETAVAAAELWNRLVVVLTRSGWVKVTNDDLASSEDFRPRFTKRRPSSGYMTQTDAAAMFKGFAGF